MSSDLVKSLSSKFELLRSAVKSSDTILITGLPSTGKTTTARRVLEEHPKYLNVHINCNNIVSTSMLYSEILKLLRRKLSLTVESVIQSKRIITAADFIDKYTQLYNLAEKEEFEKVFIVLDQVEIFIKTPMMESIVYLTSEHYISLIMISGGSKSDLLDSINLTSYKPSFLDRLFIIELNVWSKEDLIETISKQLPSESKLLYKKFVHNVVSTVYETNTKDFVELRSFCQENFQDFLKFYKNKVSELYLRDYGEEFDFSEVDFDNYEVELPAHVISSAISTFFSSFKELICRGEVRDLGILKVDRKVVLHTAALIIASYVAAYTRRSDDKKNFISHQKRISKRMKQDTSEIDPKAFTMERLIHIYRGIMILIDNLKENSRVLRHDSVLSDIQLLQDLDLISIVSGDGIDSQTRYKISYHISYNYVKSLSQPIEFDLDSLTGILAVAK